MNVSRAFFDTNVMLYMYAGDPRKGAAAARVFGDFATDDRAVVSTQVVQEFYAAGSRKLRLPAQMLREAVADLLALPLVIIDGALITAAIEKESRHRISFWDGLIVAAAEAGGADVLFTEDLNDGQQYGTVTVRNPFTGASLP